MNMVLRCWWILVSSALLLPSGCGRDWIPGKHDGGEEELPCPPGSREGGCGMEGRCIECVTDADCLELEVCSEQGRCAPQCNHPEKCADDEICREGFCSPRCGIHSDCPPGMLCKDTRYCYRKRCSEEGLCPDGWEPIAGSLACRVSTCPYDWSFGYCGFEGRCVMCTQDSDCPYLHVCSLDQGLCRRGDECINDSNCFTPGTICRQGRCIHPCVSDAECGEQEECRSGECGFVCRDDSECLYGYVCREGSCYAPRCDRESATCPAGWSVKERSMMCKWDPCSPQGLMPGACGLSGICVECFADRHCRPYLICSDLGECIQPECADGIRCDGGEVCHQGRCLHRCLPGVSCSQEEEVCDIISNLCFPVRCGPEGTCSVEVERLDPITPTRYRPVLGSLQCSLQ